MLSIPVFVLFALTHLLVETTKTPSTAMEHKPLGTGDVLYMETDPYIHASQMYGECHRCGVDTWLTDDAADYEGRWKCRICRSYAKSKRVS